VKLTRKLMLATGALLLPVSAVALVGVGSASAARSNPAGAGTVTCSKIKGSISFKPPLKAGGTSAEKTTIKVTVSGCSGGTPNPTKGAVKEIISSGTSTNGCTSLSTSAPESLTVKWAPKSLSPSTSSYSGYTLGTAGNGDEEFILPDSGGTGSTIGSFSEGSGSTATAVLNETATTIGTQCSGKGVKSLKITSGTTTL
jgi:hypothetical protein